jgi:hypothetical protein
VSATSFTEPLERLEHRIDPTDGYASEERPLLPYATLAAVFNTGLAAVLWRSRRVPQLTAADIVLLGVATHKLSRLITKDRATSFLRAPFVRYEGSAGHGEVDEEPRGHGVQRAVGELLVCPYCLATWVAGGFVAGMAVSPRRTRAVAGLFATVAIADGLHLAYRAAEDRV